MHTTSFSRQQRFKVGFWAGLIAGIIATGLMTFLSIATNGISLPEAVGATFTQLMPLSVFAFLHQVLGVDAKYYLVDGIYVGQCLVFGLLGGFCALLAEKFSNDTGKLPWFVSLPFALLLWLFTGLVFLPLTGEGFFGANLAIGVSNTMLSLAIVGLVYSLSFILIHNWLVLHQPQPQEGQETPSTRRAILRGGIAVLGLGVLGIVAWRVIDGMNTVGNTMQASAGQLVQKYKSKIVPPPTPKYGDIQQLPNFSTEITPNNKYYVVSKNLVSDPTVDGTTWKLTVDGEVAQPYTLTYDELMGLPMQEQYESMMCISNEVGGPYMSNAKWKGVRLAELLHHAGGVKPGAQKVVLYAADDYSDSIVLTKAMEPTTLVALFMNDTTLPQGHGYPARLLVPGIYGMKHVKWITRIHVVNADYQGYWQQRGWSDPAPIRLTSRIDTPLAQAELAAHKTTLISGVAFSGNKGISQVDVSVDGGQTWQTATLKQPKSQLMWVLWQLAWTPTPGTHTLVVRAIDLEGNVQNPQIAPPLPDGSSGYHTITVDAK